MEDNNRLDVEQQQALATINPMPFNQQLADLTNAVKEGWVNPIEATAVLKMFEEELKKTKKAIAETTQAEMLSYKDGYETQDFKAEMRGAGGRWDYKHISTWKEAKKELERIQDLAKMASKSNKPVVDGSTGEEIPAAVYTPGKTTVFITLKKKK